ncbi:hypothetical protein WICPIJ_007630 [Wickerhamomyces pijperi]|uniref:Uncharacterized protein n=1 Tax=Wickerhamomyces pijperi TaxID=599730 RepID=A0A9P8Q224_WICPI|nr:hypothetical protein WICPIJ_007630 [Wickerhamomyces pijperi]
MSLQALLTRAQLTLHQANDLVISKLSSYPVFHHHFNDPTSTMMTLSLTYLLVFVLIYLGVRSVLLKYGIIDLDKDEKIFIDKPIHVAHLKAQCVAVTKNKKQKLTYEIEFSPEDYDYEHDEELGTTLGLLKRKLYHLFKVSDFYEVEGLSGFTLDHVHVFHQSGRGLVEEHDDEALCLLDIQTGDFVRVLFDCQEL